jgi:hypothetical protein
MRAASAPWRFHGDPAVAHKNSSATRKAWARSRLTKPTNNATRDRQYRLDLPTLLALDEYVPALDVKDFQTMPVCATYYMWATAQSAQFITKAYEDRPPSNRASAYHREMTKDSKVVSWLKQLGHEYQHSPDADLIMLPFVDKK